MSRKNQRPVLTPEEKGLLTRLIEKGVKEIKPRIGPEGVTYDGLEDLAEEHGWQKLRQLLESLGDKGYLIVKEHDRAIFCPKCGAVHVYSKYTCPRCQSANVNRMELIEHPFCGYIGDRESFVSEDDLVCPNCKTNLGAADGASPGDGSRQDYKVIGTTFECEKCGYRFNRPNVLHVCQVCGANFDYKTARYEKLYAYEVPEQVAEVLGCAPRKDAILAPLESALRARGYQVERDGEVRGLSGGEHTFNIVAQKGSERVVVDVSMEGSQNDIISLLGKKMDVNPTTTVLIDMSDSEELSALGKVYGIKVLNGKDKNLEGSFISHLNLTESKKAEKTPQTVSVKKNE
ncbi:hypothetical protein DRO42_05740 [Candidatus Bathyarchaeota archaeon]|nr:MAG: hypothetical protein DRO42_05740 [Candidatus Bathyarchaeota archaeon]